MDSFLVVILTIITVSAVFLGIFYLYRRHIIYSRQLSQSSNFLSGLTVDKALSIINTFLTLFSVWIAIVSFKVSDESLKLAEKAFADSQVSGNNQQIVLNGSREALQEVLQTSKQQKLALDSTLIVLQTILNASNNQQTLMNKNLKLSNNQYNLMDRQWKEHQADLAKKPKLIYVIEGMDETVMKNQPKIIISEKRTLRWNISVYNVGQGIAHNPILIGRTVPDQITINEFSKPKDENEPYRFDSWSFNNYTLLPNAGITYVIDMTFPKDISEFVLRLKIHTADGYVRDTFFSFKIEEKKAQ